MISFGKLATNIRLRTFKILFGILELLTKAFSNLPIAPVVKAIIAILFVLYFQSICAPNPSCGKEMDASRAAALLPKGWPQLWSYLCYLRRVPLWKSPFPQILNKRRMHAKAQAPNVAKHHSMGCGEPGFVLQVRRKRFTREYRGKDRQLGDYGLLIVHKFTSSEIY